mmetsp:Transcript_16131/g.21089  ORF Transcript_16131/g.21089 Transcript_16131/m.21089 type:complete len:299 (-) Transcript_16131:166-1062(-)
MDLVRLSLLGLFLLCTLLPQESLAFAKPSFATTTTTVRSKSVSTTKMSAEAESATTTQQPDSLEKGVRETKIIYGIRHGRSVGNEYMRKEGSRWGDATFKDDMMYRDTPISETGRSQVEALSEKLEKEEGDWMSEVELVIVSPLTRCLETFEYGCRAALEHHFEPSPPPKILALTLAAERVFTAGETGRSSKLLEKEFSEIDWSELKHIEHDEAWWYTGEGDEGKHEEWRPHGEGQYYAVPGEPESIFEARMVALKEWVHKRPEKTILMVSHWGVLNHFTKQDMENCGICRIEFGPED